MTFEQALEILGVDDAMWSDWSDLMHHVVWIINGWTAAGYTVNNEILLALFGPGGTAAALA